MAYTTNESGRVEVYVSPFPKVEEDRVQISNAGGSRPFWSHDGKELFYLGGLTVPTQRLISANVSADAGKFKVVSRNPVWNATLQSLRFRAEPNTARPIGISRDGQRFLVLKEAVADGTEPQAERIIIVQNWTEELKRLVPIPKN
jgi:hypothetical protein